MKPYVPLIQTALWIGLALFGFFLFRREIIGRIRAGGGFKLGPVAFEAIQTQVEHVQQQINDVSDRVSELFLRSMDEYTYANLRKLGSGHFGAYQMNGGLERELRHLREVGYITVLSPSISSIPAEGDNLSNFIQISPTGLQYIEFRSSLPEAD
jgi:hypothetical protein